MTFKKPEKGFIEKYNRPYIIAGPCSAETEDQLIDTARQLASTGLVDLFRAGIWKPRTRPGTFEGIGAIGLEWMNSVKEETGLPLTVEVANKKHVEQALKHDIDVLWIGAKTTVNPFSVQELADSLKGTGVKVMIKNPINPSLSLWLGAIERFEAVGVEILAAIHRGFTEYGNKIYRHNPMWQIPIDLMMERPNLPIINDPSHICGNRILLKDVAQKSLDLNFDGMMIEVHRDPDSALSDAMQQIKPKVFEELVTSLVIRHEKGDGNSVEKDLISYRTKIDSLDYDIFNLIADRIQVVKLIGEYKKKNNISVLQRDRWEELVNRSEVLSQQLGLRLSFVQKILKNIHTESIDIQEKILND